MNDTPENTALNPVVNVPTPPVQSELPKKRKWTRRKHKENINKPNPVTESTAIVPPKPKVKKASIVAVNKQRVDIWYVKNKDPNMVYRWVRKNDDMEVNLATQLGYIPATGNEKIFGNPLDGNKSDQEGSMKVRGERILFCCPKELVDARQSYMAERRTRFRHSSKSDAQRIMQEHKGSTVEFDVESETVSGRVKKEE